MNVGIITFHFVNNFGGALQAYALWKTVSKQEGVKCEIIDYRNWFIRFTDTVRLFPITTNIEELIAGFGTMRQRRGRVRKFETFLDKYVNLTNRYVTHFQMNRRPPHHDKFICGSDQIWNPFLTAGVSSNYFLGFESKPENKIAYAPSFGTNGIPDYLKRKMKKYIDSIKYLSVREKSGQEMIKELTGREAERLIDPTFLLKKEEWEELIGEKKSDIEPYILLYIMQRDEDMYNYARELKNKLGIKLVEISRYGYRMDFVDEVVIDIGPKEFLRLFCDAAYVCTNSYHGLIYSIIFEKNFCLVPSKRFKARINNLLDLLHIKTTIDGCEGSMLTADYDKQFVHQVIEEERKKAIVFLTECLGDNA